MAIKICAKGHITGYKTCSLCVANEILASQEEKREMAAVAAAKRLEDAKHDPQS